MTRWDRYRDLAAVGALWSIAASLVVIGWHLGTIAGAS